MPTVGGDSGSWGTVLNNFLQREHTENGTHKNISGVLYADKFSGADAGEKIANCISNITSTGGICDARGFQGAQNISSDPFSGITKPVTLLLGDATFNVSATPPITLPSSLTIRGAGIGRTVLKQGANTAVDSTPFIENADTTSGTSGNSDIYLYDLTIDGNKASQTATAVYGLSLKRVSNVRISRIEIKNTISGSLFGINWTDVEVDHNRFSNWATGNVGALTLQAQSGASTRVKVHHNRCDGSVSNSSCFKFQASPTSTLTDLDVSHNDITVGYNESTSTLGIELFGTNNTVTTAIRKFTISHNQIRGENTTNNSVFGISLGGAEEGEVSGNTIENARSYGIEIIASSVTVSGNVLNGSGGSTVDANNKATSLRGVVIANNVFSNSVAPSTNGDIQIIGAAGVEGIIIANNLFLRPNVKAIRANGQPSKSLIKGNIIMGRGSSSTSNAIELLGADDNVIEGNYIFNWSGTGGVGINLNSNTNNNKLFFNTFNNVTTAITDNGAGNLIIAHNGSNVGIGTSSPASPLTVKGVTRILSSDGAEDVTFTVGNSADFTIANSLGDIILNANGGDVVPSGDNTKDLGRSDLRWRDLELSRDALIGGSAMISGSLNATSINTTGDAYFATSSGNVGIGTTSPSSQLHVANNATISGNLTIGSSTQNSNITMYSPDGTAYSCGPDNSGSFTCS